jgi:hypothetical protein
MSSQPTRPFQDAREVLKAHLASADRGAVDQVGKIALTYRVSGGPPGKRLLLMLRVLARGDVTYEHHDELRGQKPSRVKMTLPADETRSLLRQVEESGILDLRDTGGGFLPDSVIGSIGIESDGAQVTYNFLAEEHQQKSQNKEPPPPIRGLKLKFEDLCESVRKTSTLKKPARTKEKKRR